eukprot:TRINITY_DN4898_c0_g1_i2.p1 TRINITY_DN4898_c0_g1~~TRINITY_DN4898_c0_g1_i2.p1  ORF type:complete len:353 (+),score=31.77 TRINITY_DN4898_c0_g1_i2:154-1059(+)
MIYQVIFIMTGETALEVTKEPHFGRLPTFNFSTYDTEFGYYSYRPYYGLDKAFDYTPDPPSLDGPRDNILNVDFSEFSLPSFASLTKEGWGPHPEPSGNLNLLIKPRDAYDTITFFAGHDYASIKIPAMPCSSGQGVWVHFTLTKSIARHIMTEETLSGENIKGFFKKDEESFRLHFKGTSYYPIGPHHDFYPVGEHKEWSYDRCYHEDWRFLSVEFKILREDVTVYQWIGRPLLLLRFLGSVGGLWSICTGVFLLCFVKKNTGDEAYMRIMEMTWIGEKATNLLSPSDKEQVADESDSQA